MLSKLSAYGREVLIFFGKLPLHIYLGMSAVVLWVVWVVGADQQWWEVVLVIAMVYIERVAGYAEAGYDAFVEGDEQQKS